RLAALPLGHDVIAVALNGNAATCLTGVLIPACYCIDQTTPRPTASALAPAAHYRIDLPAMSVATCSTPSGCSSNSPAVARASSTIASAIRLRAWTVASISDTGDLCPAACSLDPMPVSLAV